MSELNFLITDHGFQGPFEWSHGRVSATTYIKGKVYVYFDWYEDQSLTIGVLKSELTNATVETVSEAVSDNYNQIHISSLFPFRVRRQWKIDDKNIQDMNIEDRIALKEQTEMMDRKFGSLDAQVTLLKNNSYILDGHIGLFARWWFRLKQRLIRHG